ncbi:MAG: Pyruvate kinase Pyruvate, water dikinase [Firmicutes bacterium]|nr:Pyruvate kinase Pyruvate, water dikinase [Bacillota bacterium]
MLKKTKVVCTLGPSTDNQKTLQTLLTNGMDVARLNFSHGTQDEHARRMSMVREAAVQAKVPIALMLDTKGPEVRIGKMNKEKIYLDQGKKFILTIQDVIGTDEIVSVSYKGFPRDVKSGDNVFLNDGLVGLLVNRVEGDNVITTVMNSGEIRTNKRVAVPGVTLGVPPLSERDVSDLLFGMRHKMDMVAVSFVQRAADVLAVRKILEDAGNEAVDIIAKIENAEGVRNIDEILRVSDGIMVARGDLGVEIPTEEIPLVQKLLIEKCNQVGKPVITATQMLESMIDNPRPTRAEASDVANAIFDGTDAVMLSGETSIGKYPVGALQTIAKIARRTESSLNYGNILFAKGVCPQITATGAVSHATVQMAHELGGSAIVTATETGYTARMVSSYRPRAAIIAVTPWEKIARRMQLLWGVYPVVVPSSKNTDEIVHNALKGAQSSGLVKEGDLVVITAGVPAGTPGTTNMIRLHVFGTILLRGVGIGQRIVSGKVCIIRSFDDLTEKFRPGDIMVIAGVNEDSAQYAVQSAAIITEEGGLTSHAAIIGISFGLPVVVGADEATELLPDGSVVTVDTSRGVIYQGEINAK